MLLKIWPNLDLSENNCNSNLIAKKLFISLTEIYLKSEVKVYGKSWFIWLLKIKNSLEK